MADKTEPPSQQWRRFTRLSTDRKQLRQRARKIESATLRHAHRFIVRRWENAREVRRHIIGWLVLVSLLIGATLLQGFWYVSSYHQSAPTVGTTYAEGVIGKLDTMNPLFASTAAERSASQLIFSSLLKYDRENHLTGDLASSWQFIDDGEGYRVTLRDDVYWHDGAKLTADDVVATVNLMQNPEVLSRHYDTWVNVEVKKIDERTIEFGLPGPIAPFEHYLTFGIVPEHIVGKINPSKLRESDFSRQPIGSGPFKYRDRQPIDPDKDRLVLQLTAYQDYHDGKPRLSQFQLHTYGDEAQLKQGYLSGEVNAAVGLSTNDVDTILSARPDTQISQAGTYYGTYSFFNNDSSVLKDKQVRRALQRGVDRQKLIESLEGHALPLNGPLLPEQYDADKPFRQPNYDRKAAGRLLDKAGWKLGEDGLRHKGSRKLSLSLTAPRSVDYEHVITRLSEDWRALGIEVKSELIDPKNFLRSVIQPRAYDVLVYEIELGVDPDVMSYWHSTHATSQGFNLSNYNSRVADEALQTARTVLGSELRNEKYLTFMSQWMQDVPAIALYQPTLRYVSTPGTTTMMADGNVPNSTARYRSVEYWSVGRDIVYTTP